MKQKNERGNERGFYYQIRDARRQSLFQLGAEKKVCAWLIDELRDKAEGFSSYKM